MDILNLNIIDVVIVLLILCAGVVGMKRGVFKEIVMTVGFIVLIIVSFVLKNPVAELLSLHLPFFNFGGVFNGAEVMNILLYQVVAFIIVFALLSIVFYVVLAVTKVFEKILNFTIILGMISKFLGFFVGLIEGYILVYIICIVLSFPVFNQSFVQESTLKQKMLNNTPVLSNISKKMIETVDDIVALTKSDIKNKPEEFNRQSIDIMLKRDFITPKYVEKLIEAKKITTKGIPEIVNKYK